MFYDLFGKNWKFLAAIPILLLVISSAVLISNTITKGSFLERDVELSGGKIITWNVENLDIKSLEKELPYANVKTTQGIRNSVIVTVPIDVDENSVIEKIKLYSSPVGEPSVRTVGPVLGNIFFEQAQIAIITAFILMAVVVFILFRKLVPASLVILAAVTDIVVTAAAISFIGVKLSLGVIVALVTLIGYSVDTDILLTSELLKKRYEADINSKIWAAMKTGVTMSLTTMAATAALFMVSGSLILEQIAIVLFIGVFIDIMATWLGNAVFLKIWLERKNRKMGVSV